MRVRPSAVVASLLLACSTVAPGRADRAQPSTSVFTDPSRVEALLVNGGGTSAANYQSHLLHVRMLVDVLREAGVPGSRVTILSGDGPDPAADVALREVQPEDDYWLLAGTRLERPFRTPVTFESSRVQGFALRAATLGEVDRWFATVGSRLRPGDTLLLYVTDHGTKNPRDTRDNRITLWGKGSSLSVSELRSRLSRLDRRVRVVMLMSQCYSGSFTNVVLGEGAGLPRGNVCGYYSTTAERPAYGCYPEVRDQDNVGHSFDFIQELGQTGSFRNAQLGVLQHDGTPDAPLRTSDAFAEELLRKKAAAKGVEYEAFVDGLLARAWKRKGTWEPEIRLLDAIGRNFGSFSPRSLAEIREQATQLPELGKQLDTHAKAWKASLGDANRANLERFLATKKEWAERVSDAALKADGGSARELAGSFLFDLADFTRADEATQKRLSALRGRADTARSLAYRMEVRQGVVLRMRAILATIAGREYLAKDGTREERAAWEALLSCESLSLPLARPVPGMSAVERAAFPSMEDDLASAREVFPAWLGIRFGDVPPATRRAQKLKPGAALVTAVYPDSPAAEAGLEAGDVVVGPPEAPFDDPRQIREWTMLAAVDRPATLAVLRDEESFQVTVVPRPYPVQWPDLPGPPKVSNAAPPWSPLQLTAYRGSLPGELRGSGPHLLYFWATWCGPCKAALPELLAFERERQTPVLAITDEAGETLDAFFSSFGKAFPERVAMDAARRSFLAYGVSGTPTFVLVDEHGTIRSYSVGYTPAKGLGIEGWTWSGRPSATGPGGR